MFETYAVFPKAEALVHAQRLSFCAVSCSPMLSDTPSVEGVSVRQRGQTNDSKAMEEVFLFENEWMVKRVDYVVRCVPRQVFGGPGRRRVASLGRPSRR